MISFTTLEPKIDTNNRITFLLDWELTLKCNLDCTYCSTGLYGGHDNTTKHPPLDKCLETLDFMFRYADLYMSIKPKGIKYVILNVYGGESLHHPDIIEILMKVREKYKEYENRWHLTVTTTTNAIVSDKKLDKIIPLIDEFTCSYHSENTERQKLQFKKNLITIKEQGKRVKSVILMHSEYNLFKDSQEMINWCLDNDIQYLPRQLDHPVDYTQFNYSTNQVIWLQNFYREKTRNSDHMVKIVKRNDRFDMSDSGRACCGGRTLCHSQSDRQSKFFVENKFPDWYCSVNEFFVYVKQVTGEIFVNKDCMMNFDGTVGPIGILKESNKLLEWTKKNLEHKTMPVIQCKKTTCFCGLCAPKAATREEFDNLIEKYHR